MNADIRVRLPVRIAEAVELAAQKNFTTISEYTRQSLLARLRNDGFLIEHDTPIADEHATRQLQRR